MLVDQPDRFNRRMVRVDELRTVLRGADRAYQIISAASQLAELRRFSADRKIGAADAKGTERARKQLERDIEFVDSVHEGTDGVTEILRTALERFDRAVEEDAAS